MLRTRWREGLVGVALIVALALPAGAAAKDSPYPLLVQRAGLRVYAPGPREPWGRCPAQALPLRARDLSTAKRAVLLAVPRLYARHQPPRIDTGDATARAARLGTAVWTRGGLARSTCGRRVAARTAAVSVGFPRVTWSASLSSATFFVARLRSGWVLWHQAH